MPWRSRKFRESEISSALPSRAFFTPTGWKKKLRSCRLLDFPSLSRLENGDRKRERHSSHGGVNTRFVYEIPKHSTDQQIGPQVADPDHIESNQDHQQQRPARSTRWRSSKRAQSQ